MENVSRARYRERRRELDTFDVQRFLGKLVHPGSLCSDNRFADPVLLGEWP